MIVTIQYVYVDTSEERRVKNAKIRRLIVIIFLEMTRWIVCIGREEGRRKQKKKNRRQERMEIVMRKHNEERTAGREEEGNR